MANCNSLLLEDEPEDDTLLQFYQSNLSTLKKLLMIEIPPKILKDMAVMLHDTLVFTSDWKEFVYDMGVQDNITLARIAYKSDRGHEPAIYIAFCGPLRRKSFGEIIDVLVKHGRRDVLHIVKPFVEGVLNGNNSERVKSAFPSHVPDEMHGETQTESDDHEILDVSVSRSFEQIPSICINSSLADGLQNFEASCQKGSSNLKKNKFVCEGKQQSEIVTYNRNDVSSAKNCETDTENIDHSVLKDCERVSEEIAVIPSAPISDPVISVFIIHAELDREFAKKLSIKLQNEQMVVRILSEVDYLLMMNREEALNAIIHEVDFVVPIVSMTFLQQIHPHRGLQFLESADAVSNLYIYQLLMNEYTRNRCRNFRVRPVLLPEMDRRALMKDVLLTCALRLWNEVPKLVSTLIKTKRLISAF